MPGLVPGIHAFLACGQDGDGRVKPGHDANRGGFVLPIFASLDEPNHWRPSPLAAGPFAGLQGGAIASLLTAEIEARAAARNWGTAISSAAWFLRPTPMADLRSEIRVVSEGGRVSVIDSTLYPAGEDAPCATVRVTLSRERAVEVPGFAEAGRAPADPTKYPLRTLHLVTARQWFMDAMEARFGDGVAWFRMNHEIIAGAGPLSSILGPADWTHGIARPVQNVVADPNPNLSVQLFRRPRGEWVGVRAEARWAPSAGLGVGSGTLLDVEGEIGRVSMSVVLVPFPKPAMAAG
jgi:acyl-CoA thioesterase superfamily protein/acyl-Coa thioesterase superfamily protein